MSSGERGWRDRADVLEGRAIRMPLRTYEDELQLHKTAMKLAEGCRRKADMLSDPSISVATAYDREFEYIAERCKYRLRQVAGDDYEGVARAYIMGERDDLAGELAVYYLEALWRIQRRSTVQGMLFFPLIIRYPDSYTANLRFPQVHTTTESVLFESPEHGEVGPDDPHAQQYFDESQYEQERAADYLRRATRTYREQFPHPDDLPEDEPVYGGIVGAAGRRGSMFTEMLAPVEPDRDRFDEPITEPTLVPAGKEAERTAREYLPSGAEVVG
ncbi:hypothetical protein [Halobellus sp. EA9]|uniref:hypothetical protein n=1 Tax=Halobellus sp. EA9 TaxID=3421647 RepID=UPI003EB77762